MKGEPKRALEEWTSTHSEHVFEAIDGGELDLDAEFRGELLQSPLEDIGTHHMGEARNRLQHPLVLNAVLGAEHD